MNVGCPQDQELLGPGLLQCFIRCLEAMKRDVSTAAFRIQHWYSVFQIGPESRCIMQRSDHEFDATSHRPPTTANSIGNSMISMKLWERP